MATMNISVTDDMKAFVEAQLAEEGYTLASEYLRAFIREAQKRKAKRALEAKLRRRTAERAGDPDDPAEDWETRNRGVGAGRFGRPRLHERPGVSSSDSLQHRETSDDICRHLHPMNGTLKACGRLSYDQAECDVSAIVGNCPASALDTTPTSLSMPICRYFPISRFPKYIVFYRRDRGRG